MGNAQLNKQDHVEGTALHLAAYGDQLEPAKYLVARGCSLTVQHNFGRTALDYATRRNQPQLVKFLTSASDFVTNNDYLGLVSLCAPFYSPFLERKTHKLRYTTMLCLTAVEKRGDAVAGCTLLSRIFQHEEGLVRHTLSYVRWSPLGER